MLKAGHEIQYENQNAGKIKTPDVKAMCSCG
jgi:hypothetical protein